VGDLDMFEARFNVAKASFDTHEALLGLDTKVIEFHLQAFYIRAEAFDIRAEPFDIRVEGINFVVCGANLNGKHIEQGENPHLGIVVRHTVLRSSTWSSPQRLSRRAFVRQGLPNP